MSELDISQLSELFFSIVFRNIKDEHIVPNLNFKFQDYGSLDKFFEDGPTFLYHAYKRDIAYIQKHNDDDCLSIYINNSALFFGYLLELLNEQMQLLYEYDVRTLPIETAIDLMRYIWLRMGINDVSDIEQFLDKQLQFMKNRTFDTPDPIEVGTFEGYPVTMKTKYGDLYDETTRRMVFTIGDDYNNYELPHILYDIDDNNICYIYGVQCNDKDKDKHIERKLYQLNKDIEEPNVHPSKVCSLLLFIKQLRSKGITKIIVPGMQVLNYRYHEILSVDAEKRLEKAKILAKNNPDDTFLQNRVGYVQNWYNHVHNNQDKISFLKTEELYNLMYRMMKHLPDMVIINDVGVQGDSLDIRLQEGIMNSNDLIGELSSRQLNTKTNNMIVIGEYSKELIGEIPETCVVTLPEEEQQVQVDNITVDLSQVKVEDLLTFILDSYDDGTMDHEYLTIKFKSLRSLITFQRVLRRRNIFIQIVLYNMDGLTEQEQMLINELFYYYSENFNVTAIKRQELSTYFLTGDRRLDPRENFTKYQLERYVYKRD